MAVHQTIINGSQKVWMAAWPTKDAGGLRKTEQMMRRYAAVTDQTLRAAAEAVSGNESHPAQRRGASRSVIR